MNQQKTMDILNKVREGTIFPEEAILKLRTQPFEDLGYAKPDHHRGLRQGIPEVIYGAGKTAGQIVGISTAMLDKGQKLILITRLPSEVAESVKESVPLQYHEMARIGIIGEMPEPDGIGKVVVATGGTSDMPVAEEAALTAEALGNEVVRLYDVGVAGLHRLLLRLDVVMEARVIIAIAGMEGALASVVGGLADCPVIGVPTSVGYGASFNGLSALLTMLNSCASGVSVVNIDNGFGAGYLASMINHQKPASSKSIPRKEMKTLYLECNMGAAGDMLMAALLELHSDPDDFLRRLNNVGIPNVAITAESSIKSGITGTQVTIKINDCEEGEHHHRNHDHNHDHNHEHHHEHEHHHSSFHHIEHLIGHLGISDMIKKNALAVYELIAEAESHAHGVPVSQIHFHEVGEMDAIADIIGVCMLIDEFAPDIILASPVHVGSGHVNCAHGVLPVPVPATAHILQNIPMYSDGTQGELCTPTGAALLKHFVKDFCKMPMISVSKLGYGMGKKDFDKVNCVRAYMGVIRSNDMMD